MDNELVEMNNHMKSIVRVLIRIAEALERVCDEIEALPRGEK